MWSDFWTSIFWKKAIIIKVNFNYLFFSFPAKRVWVWIWTLFLWFLGLGLGLNLGYFVYFEFGSRYLVLTQDPTQIPKIFLGLKSGHNCDFQFFFQIYFNNQKAYRILNRIISQTNSQKQNIIQSTYPGLSRINLMKFDVMIPFIIQPVCDNCTLKFNFTTTYLS